VLNVQVIDGCPYTCKVQLYVDRVNDTVDVGFGMNQTCL